MSDSDEVAALPDAATCDQRSKQFADFTGTDEACAHFFLQDCQWDLEVQHELSKELFLTPKDASLRRLWSVFSIRVPDLNHRRER